MWLRSPSAAGARACVLAAIAACVVASTAQAQTSGKPDAGQMLYQAKCGGCHSLDANRIGPAHRGVVGRRVASAPGYAYSPALKKLGGVWTPMRLDRWLKDPQLVAPGAKMFLMVGDSAERRDIIAYLAANSPVSHRAR